MARPKINHKILIYDIEVPHLKARVWRLGDQPVRHDQLLPSANEFHILTIAYKWYHQSEIHILDCGKDGQNEKQMIMDFDKLIKEADVVIGKNNHRFDNKFLNTLRLAHSNNPMPNWCYKSDDLESQIRRYFALPSYSLDYLSNISGQGGKVKMERSDWIQIEDYIELNKISKFVKKSSDLNEISKHFYKKSAMEVKKEGKKAFNKMMFYNKKDVKDTDALLVKVMPHVQLKYNAATAITLTNKALAFACITCGSNQVCFTGTVCRGAQNRAEFYCQAHKGYAGSRPFVYGGNHNKRYTGPMGK